MDVSSTELAVPEVLRRTGIHALLGGKLTSRSGLFGVACVEIAETRAFAARGSRRLEWLAEPVVAHLDTVVLIERLTATIEALRKQNHPRALPDGPTALRNHSTADQVGDAGRVPVLALPRYDLAA